MATRSLKGALREIWTETQFVSGAVTVATTVPVALNDTAVLSRLNATVYVESVTGSPTVSKPVMAINQQTGSVDVSFQVTGGQITYTLEVSTQHPQALDASYAGFGTVVGMAASGSGVSLGDKVHIVGVPGSGCPFSSVQAAVDEFESHGSLVLPPRLVLITPGSYAEDVVVRQDNIHFLGIGKPKIQSLTFTNCTPASIAAFNASGDWHDLKPDIALYEFASCNEVVGINFNRESGDAWTGLADASLRFLGHGDGGSTLGASTFTVRNCRIDSTFTGGNAISLTQVCRTKIQASFVKGFIEARQIGSLSLEQSDIPGKVYLQRQTSENEPAMPSAIGINGHCSYISDLVLEGDAPMVGSQQMRKCVFDAIHDGAGSASSVAEFRDCYVDGDIEISNPGPAIVFKAGRYMGRVIGAGAGGFVGLVGNNS